MEDVPYRSPVKEALKTDTPPSIDERDISTLVQVRDIMREYLDQMSSNFNAFDSSLNPEQLYIQVKARQEAHALLEPLYQAVTTVIDKVHEQKRG